MPTVEELQAKIDKLEKENAALKEVKAASEPKKVEVPSEKDRTFTVEKKKYRFGPVSHVFVAGVKTELSEVLKDEELLEQYAKNGHILVKEL